MKYIYCIFHECFLCTYISCLITIIPAIIFSGKILLSFIKVSNIHKNKTTGMNMNKTLLYFIYRIICKYTFHKYHNMFRKINSYGFLLRRYISVPLNQLVKFLLYIHSKTNY